MRLRQVATTRAAEMRYRLIQFIFSSTCAQILCAGYSCCHAHPAAECSEGERCTGSSATLTGTEHCGGLFTLPQGRYW